MAAMLKFLLVNTFIIKYVASSCTFPSEITGTWYSSHKGALNFTSTQVISYPIFMSASVGSLDFNCDDNSGSQYLLKYCYLDLHHSACLTLLNHEQQSPVKGVIEVTGYASPDYRNVSTQTAIVYHRNVNDTEMSTIAVIAFGSLIEAYICIDLHRVSMYKYYYYLGTKLSNTNNDYVYGRPNGTSVSMSMACNRATPYDERTFITLVRNESVSDGVAEATCPSNLLAAYSSLTIADHDGTNACSGNTVTGCLDKVKLNYTYASCATSKVYSSGGKFTCLYSITKDQTTYLSVWNLDDAVDGTSTYRFTCLALKKSGNTLYATEFPNFCSDENQDSTTVTSPGIKVTMTSVTSTCSVSVTSVSNPGWVVLILVLVFVVVGGVIVGICFLKKHTPKISMLELNRIS